MSDQQGDDPKAHSDEDMEALLKSLRAVAREDDAAIAGFSGEVPALSREARGTIAERILALQAEARGTADGRVDGSLAARRERRRGRAAWWAGAGVVVAAAAWALVVWTRPPSGIATNDGALPPYVVLATGGVAETRGATGDGASGRTAAVQRLNAQSELQIACSPESAVAGPVAARAFFVQGGTSEEVRPELEVASTGAVALRLRASALPPHHAGPGELRVVIGRPAPVSAVSRPLDATDGDGFRWLLVPLDLAN